MKRVLFENHHLYYLPNFMPIMEELKRRGGVEIFASIPQFINKEEREILYRTCEKLDVGVIRRTDEIERVAAIKKMAFDVIVVGNVGQLNELVTDKTIAVMVYHGIGLKQTYYKDIDPRIDLRAVESQPRLEELEQHGHKNLVLTGFTKCDPLLTADGEKSKNLERLGLRGDQKTLLYAPSFYPSSQEKLIPILEELSFEFNILIKLHNFSWHQKRYLHQSKAMEALVRRSESIYLVPPEAYNIIPYYRMADCLISDISSTMFEFLALDKPIIMAECFTLRLKHRIFNKRFLKKIDLSRMEKVDFAYRLMQPEKLPALVYHVLDYPEDLEKERRLAQEEYLYKVDGKSSYRLVNAIEEKLGEKFS